MRTERFNIYKVSCEFYDMTWLVSATNKKEAKAIVKGTTEAMNWHLDYPDEKRTWEAEQMFKKSGEMVETRDI